jgi:hypothetical protein
MNTAQRLITTVTLQGREYDIIRLEGPVDRVVIYQGRMFVENATAIESALALELEATRQSLVKARCGRPGQDCMSCPDLTCPGVFGV